MDRKAENHNSSTSSASSNDSQGFYFQQKTSSKSSLPKGSSKLKHEKKREKRWKKNKIGKEDFFNKTTEFRTWLQEKKNVQFDTLTTPKAKTIFKTFMKKWNGKKLDEKYYSGLGMYWAVTSPSAYSHAAMPMLGEEKDRELKATHFTPLYDAKFSTFGKKEGERALRELQKAEADGTPTRTFEREEHVYDVPLSGDEALGSSRMRRGHANKSRPALSQLFLRPGEATPPHLEVEDDNPMFAKVTRQRPMSCRGRIQNAPVLPHAPDLPTGRDTLKMLPPTGCVPPPQSECQRAQAQLGYSAMQRQMRNSTSTGSTDSASSCASSSTCSSTTTHSSMSSLGPKPPPRTSSISSSSGRDMRAITKVILAKMGVTPTKTPLVAATCGQAPPQECAAEQVSSPPLPPPPPPIVISEPDRLYDLPPPPPECAPSTGYSAPGVLSPPLPPPPSPLKETRCEQSDANRRQSMRLVQVLPQRMPFSSMPNAAMASFPTPPPPPPPPIATAAVGIELRNLAAKSQGLNNHRSTIDESNKLLISNGHHVTDTQRVNSQDTVLLHVTPHPPPMTRRRIMTPHHGLTPGPVHVAHQGTASEKSLVKSPKRQSDSPLKSNLAITPAKKITIDILYNTTCV